MGLFKYLGHNLKEIYDDSPGVIVNLQKACKSWSRLLHILDQDGKDAQTLGRFYLAIVQSVLIFKADTWFLIPHIRRLWGVFHNRVAHRISVKHSWRREDGT